MSDVMNVDVNIGLNVGMNVDIDGTWRGERRGIDTGSYCTRRRYTYSYTSYSYCLFRYFVVYLYARAGALCNSCAHRIRGLDAMSFCLIEWSCCILYIRVVGGGALLSYDITLHNVT